MRVGGIGQVSFTVLLDNYIDASAQIAAEEQLERAELAGEGGQVRGPLQPLLMRLACEFTDDQDLSDRLLKLYQVRAAAQEGGRRVGMGEGAREGEGRRSEGERGGGVGEERRRRREVSGSDGEGG